MYNETVAVGRDAASESNGDVGGAAGSGTLDDAVVMGVELVVVSS